MTAAEIKEGAVIDGNYKLLGLLGKGGMGEVWEGEHTRLPKRVAVKFLLDASTGQQELVMRFRREAEIASRLVHPSIVEVFDFNVLMDETPYLVMERLVGEDLRARLDRGRMPLGEAREIIKQVASGLELAHREGVVHRDLKPENLFLCDQADGTLRAKILDFGISKIQGTNTNATRDDRILGTPGYMAPEQAMGKNSQIDARTDVFSLAAIFYEMLTGTSAFVGNTLAEMVYKIVHVAPEPLSVVAPDLPPAISRVVERALSKDPADRHQSVSHFASGITAVEFLGEVAAPARDVDVVGATHISQDNAADPAALVKAHREAEANEGEAISALDTAIAPATPGEVVNAQASTTWGGRPWIPIAAAIGMLALGAALTLTLAGVFRGDAASGAVAVAMPPAAQLANTAAPRALPRPVSSAEAAQNTPPAVQAAPEPSAQGAGMRALKNVPPTAAAASGAGAKYRKTVATPKAAMPKQGSAPAAGPATSKSAELLARSDAALKAGDPSTALRLARSSLYEAKSSRAYLLMAKAYCAKRDVGMVRAMLRNLGAGAKRNVRAYCQVHNLNLP